MGGDFAIAGSTEKAVYALLTALLSITVALSGFAAGQYLTYKNRRLESLKKVADALFFKSLDIGKDVLTTIIDLAEEEECKEMILVFHVLVVNQGPMDENAVDKAAEQWIMQNLGTTVDFDMGKALDSLAAIRGNNDVGDDSIVKRDGGAYSAVTSRLRHGSIGSGTMRFGIHRRHCSHPVQAISRSNSRAMITRWTSLVPS